MSHAQPKPDCVTQTWVERGDVFFGSIVMNGNEPMRIGHNNSGRRIDEERYSRCKGEELGGLSVY
jgi:hypothetical protein